MEIVLGLEQLVELEQDKETVVMASMRWDPISAKSTAEPALLTRVPWSNHSNSTAASGVVVQI